MCKISVIINSKLVASIILTLVKFSSIRIKSFELTVVSESLILDGRNSNLGTYFFASVGRNRNELYYIFIQRLDEA